MSIFRNPGNAGQAQTPRAQTQPAQAQRQPQPPAQQTQAQLPAQQPVNTASFFDGGNEAKFTNTLRHITSFPGLHEVEVIEIKAGVTFQGQRPWYGADCRVLSSDNPELKPGSIVAWSSQKDATYPQYFFTDVKRFIGSAAGIEPQGVREEHMAASLGEDQPLAGRKLMVKVDRAWNGKTKLPNTKRDGSPAYNATCEAWTGPVAPVGGHVGQQQDWSHPDPGAQGRDGDGSGF
jgi:hypothetical protein